MYFYFTLETTGFGFIYAQLKKNVNGPLAFTQNKVNRSSTCIHYLAIKWSKASHTESSWSSRNTTSLFFTTQFNPTSSSLVPWRSQSCKLQEKSWFWSFVRNFHKICNGYNTRVEISHNIYATSKCWSEASKG